MPLTDKGEKIKKAMEGEYGKEKGERVFYASKNAGKIKGVDSRNDESASFQQSYMDAVNRRDGAGIKAHHDSIAVRRMGK